MKRTPNNGPETVNLSRRRFVISAGVAGTGLVVGLNVPFGIQMASASETPPEVNAWVVISPDETVTIRIARSEMGQGTLTGLAQMTAEELECDWDKVTWEFPTPNQSLKRDRPWGSFSTGGSRGIRESHQYVREGGAVARELLLEAAAQTWSVPRSECSVSKGVITHVPTGRQTTYGAVAAKAATLTAPESVTLKDPKDWTLIGKDVARLDTADKVTGALKYGADIKLPGMLNASVKACPVPGGKRAAYNADKAKTMPGVHAVLEVGEDAIAVVADTWWQANSALKTIDITWDTGDLGAIDSAAIQARLEEGLDAEQAWVGHERGNTAALLKEASDRVTADYSYPFQSHAPMEPMNATVLYTKDRCEAWAPTQNGEAALEALADAVGMLREQCEVHKTILGGGFGRRGMQDWLAQAGLIAKQMPGVPIKLLWSREEDQLQGRYHPITRCRLTAKLADDGQPEALHMRISGQSILAALRAPLGEERIDPVVFQSVAPEGDHAFIYGLDNFLADHAMRNTHFRPGFWRGVNINQNVFYIESFIDELARKANKDPLDYRRQLLKDSSPEGLAVLEMVAKKAGWGRELPANTGLGLAVCKAFGSYVAACAEVSVTDGKLRMKKIWAATDCGYAVNPQQIEAQVSGSFAYGLSAALYGEMTVKDGAMQETNFDRYPVIKLADMPEVETVVMPSGGFWGGVGEPTIAVAAPAVLNAVYAATGVRIRHLPVKDQALA